MSTTRPSLSPIQCRLVLAAGFFGWLLAGVQLAVSSIVMRNAAADLLGVASTREGTVGQWFGWLTSSFMLGAALGGYLLGWVGDRFGRKRAMALSVFVYSLFAGATYFAQSTPQLLILRFLTGIGVGGMWPNGIALVSEAWPNMSRPMLAGIIGTAANIGIMCFSILLLYEPVTTESWRWVMAWSAAPVVLAIGIAMVIPESPRWLALKTVGNAENAPRRSAMIEIFRPPLLKTTLFGIVLGTIPLFGGWGSTNWANAWSSEVGERIASESSDAEEGANLKALGLLARSAPGSIASLLGGALAMRLGRRRSYFLLAVGCLICSQVLFRSTDPSERSFYLWMAALGLFSGFFFGWLPLCLPELFPTRVRSTGAGVSFNFGRIATAFGIVIAAGMLRDWFHGDYARIGGLTSWIYAIGAVAICFAPSQQHDELSD